MRLTLFSTHPCHLCVQAEELVRRALPSAELEVVDIGEDDALIEQYGTLIPVLVYAEKEIHWPFSLLDIRTLVS